MRQSGKLFGFAGLVLVGCAASTPESATEAVVSPDRWDDNTENPANILPGASVLLADIITAEDVGKSFGVDDARIPYPDTYWPFVDDGIDAKWNDGEASPLEKIMNLADPARVADAKNWEHTQHGKAVPGVASWWGHCPGWTGAAMSEAPMLHPVFAKSDGAGSLAACASGEAGCTKFDIADVNALEAEVYVDGRSGFLGARCDTKPGDIKRDEFGRIERDGTGCHGLNAGALMVVLASRMKKDHLPMAIDAQGDFNTDQIWNQPSYRYAVNAYRTLSKDDAIKLVAGNKNTHGYQWNKDAKGFIFVDITLSWVSEMGPNTEAVSGKESTRTTRMEAVIELDRKPSDSKANVIGGEYLEDEANGADRLTVPPFVWISHGPGAEDLDLNVGGNNHNPYLKPSLVRKLVSMGTTAAPVSPDAGTAGDDGGTDAGSTNTGIDGGTDAGSP